MRGFNVAKGYQDIKLPERKTAASAGYDFYVAKTITVEPGQKALVETGVKAYMASDEVLKIYMRSSSQKIMIYRCPIMSASLMRIIMKTKPTMAPYSSWFITMEPSPSRSIKTVALPKVFLKNTTYPIKKSNPIGRVKAALEAHKKRPDRYIGSGRFLIKD